MRVILFAYVGMDFSSFGWSEEIREEFCLFGVHASCPTEDVNFTLSLVCIIHF